jgi:hypothetical protein
LTSTSTPGGRKGQPKLSRVQSRHAAAHGRAARTKQATTLGRAIPASRDADLVRTTIDTALVRKAARVIDADPTLVAWAEQKVAASQAGPGRPAALSMRTMLMSLWLLNVSMRNFHIINAPALMSNLGPRVRRRLGIDYLDSTGRACQVSYGQLLRSFNNLANAFDPFVEGLSADEAKERAANLQELTNRLVRASVNKHAHVGDYAVDATLVWAWDRPRRTASGKSTMLNGKIEKRGRDGDNGPPLTMSQIVSDSDDEFDPDNAGFIEDPIGVIRDEEASNAAVTAAPLGRKNRRRPGAKWVGRGRNMSKAVYGYALHTATVTDHNAPPVIEALAVTPAPAHPAKSVLPLLRSLHDARLAEAEVADKAALGELRLLGNVVADPAYTSNVDNWQLPIRAMGGSAIFRLHRNNQAGRRLVRGTTFVDGRPHCACMPDRLALAAYPKFPYKRAALDAYQALAVQREPFEMKANGGYRSTGSRQFLSPHFDKTTKSGGCVFCVDAFGGPVVDPTTGKLVPRCCSNQTLTFTKQELGLYQDAAFGTPKWEKLWNPRNRVEGSYGVMKGLSLVNWGHDYHHFTGLARETLVATFAVMAYNFHIQRTWAARLRLTEDPPVRPGSLPSAQPTETLPDWVATPKRETTPQGPKGLDVLGTPRHSGP